MVLGWVFGRHLVRVGAGTTRVSGKTILWISGATSLVIFAVVRWHSGYGNMFLPRADDSWQQWLHVSKYPPSLSYGALELGILFLGLALRRTIECASGSRERRVLVLARLRVLLPVAPPGIRDPAPASACAASAT
jgi:hypothetical protein